MATLNNRFVKHAKGETCLKDMTIITSLRNAARMYEDGAIAEVRDLLAEIIDAIDEWEENQEAQDG